MPPLIESSESGLDDEDSLPELPSQVPYSVLNAWARNPDNPLSEDSNNIGIFENLDKNVQGLPWQESGQSDDWPDDKTGCIKTSELNYSTCASDGAEQEECFYQNDTGAHEQETPRRTQPLSIELPESTLTQPRSLFDGFEPPAPEFNEGEAVAKLLQARVTAGSVNEEEGHIEFELSHFAIYIDKYPYHNELRPLHHLSVRKAGDRLFFDGVLSCGETRVYVRRVPFRCLPIGNYGVQYHTVDDQIWIHSEFNERSKKEIYYKLVAPGPEYRRFYKPFLWIANLTKHVIDYCDHLTENGRSASIHDFEKKFSIWILRHHLDSDAFRGWIGDNRSSDFRAAIVANIEFIWRETYGLSPNLIARHQLWHEVKTFGRYRPNLAISDSQMTKKEGFVPKTIVTPYAYNLFSHMVFGHLLERTSLEKQADKRRASFMRDHQPPQPNIARTVKRSDTDRAMLVTSIRPGDVISTKPDDASTDTKWKQEASRHHSGEHLWFGLVQKVHVLSRDRRSFDVLWMYQPIDSPCSVMKYPWENELFLSDNCTCHHGMAKVKGEQVLSTHEVEWFGGPSSVAEFFVRQTYVASECQWTTLRREHMACGNKKVSIPEREPYAVGDAVLVETKEGRLENFIVEAFFEEGGKPYARLRRLWRRRDVDPEASNAPPNELIYTQQLVEASTRRINRRCLLRTFHADEKITRPYDRYGTGNAFYITHEEVQLDDKTVSFQPLMNVCPEPLRQAYSADRTPRSKKLRGLDLFCGGGNFGRGLEDGDAIEMHWANDIWTNAIHTYMANTKPGQCKPYLGSVDDLLLRALRGDKQTPQPGDVDFISAGSPCPGFSLLTMDRTTDKQRKNQSLIASFASYIDLYRPIYGVLENVPQMVNVEKLRDSCVFSQLVCAIVGLGYQLQIKRLDSWCYGAPQSRSRVFLLFTAPGYRMPRDPAPTHDHPPGTPLQKLGFMSCGLPIETRDVVPTPFKYVSASEATRGLPNIYEGKADYCVGFPDHRVSIGMTPAVRKQLRAIPTQPFEMNYSKARYGRPGMPAVMSPSDLALFPNNERSHRTKTFSRGWGRLHPGKVFGTIATICAPTDARVGGKNHWQQHRPITILEARRAQGFLDHEIILGTPAAQYKIIGNSVARQVALAIGLVIHEAWYGTLLDEKPTGQPVESMPAEEVSAFLDFPDPVARRNFPATTAHPVRIIPSQPQKRPRFARACEYCRSQHMKCDGCQPRCGRRARAHSVIKSIEGRIDELQDSETMAESSSDELQRYLPYAFTPQSGGTITPTTSESTADMESRSHRKRPAQIFGDAVFKKAKVGLCQCRQRLENEDVLARPEPEISPDTSISRGYG
ncbi:S-adenosyl-L-methionine-dependent methyltransferase [Xylariaceae sp. FL0016]|nr:S-adenosyl-L-methionine-dependent methyltransferase [Xylariaceae sp. FL0016]